MISGGESFFNRFMFAEWLARGAYQLPQPDSVLVGLGEAWHIARMAKLHGYFCVPHNWCGGFETMSNAHFVAGISNRLMLEVFMDHNRLKDEVFREPFPVVDGYLTLPEKPGYGVEKAPNLERKFPYVPGMWNKPNPVLMKS